MKNSSHRLKIIAAVVLVNSCPLLAAPAQTSVDVGATPREFLEKARASIVIVTGEDKDGLSISPGMGFSIGKNLIATDNRIVQSAVRLHIIVPGQESTPANVMSRDSYRFATILTVTTTQNGPLSLGNSDSVAVKDKVYLVNGPDPNVAATEGAVKKVISINDKHYFQITAAISSAGRGGPVLNSKGEVIGIAGESPDGKSPGFTIPAAYLTTLLRYRNMEIPTGVTAPGGGVGSAKANGEGSGSAPSTGPGQGSNVPGGSSQPGALQHIPLAPVAPAAPVTLVDTKPILLNNPRPLYTEQARRNLTSGVVSMRILVDVAGDVKKTKVTRGLPDGLIEQALAAAYQLKFKPATRNGLAVPWWMPMEVEFNLK